jgi:hypothetical protein
MYVLFTGEQLDFRPLDAFLQEQEIEQWCRELIIQDVYNAICRYHGAPQRDIVISQLENVLAAAKKLADKLPKLGTRYYAQFHWAMHQTTPPKLPDELQSERVRALQDLPGNLEKICAGAEGALKGFKKIGRPEDPKVPFVRELAEAWERGTGDEPGISSAVTWDNPTTLFSKFVKRAVSPLPDTTEFEIGFADLLRRALKVAEPAK